MPVLSGRIKILIPWSVLGRDTLATIIQKDLRNERHTGEMENDKRNTDHEPRITEHPDGVLDFCNFFILPFCVEILGQACSRFLRGWVLTFVSFNDTTNDFWQWNGHIAERASK